MLILIHANECDDHWPKAGMPIRLSCGPRSWARWFLCRSPSSGDILGGPRLGPGTWTVCKVVRCSVPDCVDSQVVGLSCQRCCVSGLLGRCVGRVGGRFFDSVGLGQTLAALPHLLHLWCSVWPCGWPRSGSHPRDDHCNLRSFHAPPNAIKQLSYITDQLLMKIFISSPVDDLRLTSFVLELDNASLLSCFRLRCVVSPIGVASGALVGFKTLRIQLSIASALFLLQLLLFLPFPFRVLRAVLLQVVH